MADKAKKTEKDDGWGGWHGYMEAKILKLDGQFNKQKTVELVKSSDIFSGVVIFVNGYTQPSSDELKKLMGEHGGGYQHYYSRSSCTHIVATNLAGSKIQNLKNENIVHPNWILDSIKVGNQLPIHKYLLFNRKSSSQLKLQLQAKEENAAVSTRTTDVTVQPTDVATVSTDNIDPGEGPSGLFDEHSSDEQRKKADQDEISDDEWPENADIIGAPHISNNIDDILADGNDTKIATTLIGTSSEVPNAPELSKYDYKGKLPTKIAKAGDSNFVSEFYSNSRLHHLSMWKSELKKFATMIHQNAKDKGLLGSNKKKNTTNKLIVHIDMDSFFVSVALKERPELRGKPVAVCHAGKGGAGTTTKVTFNSMSEIASCSYEARAKGIKNGMMLGAAKRLCPDLICVSYYFEKYREVSQKFYEILVNYTCSIEAVSCDEALLDISDIISEGTSPLNFVKQIRDVIFQTTGCTASAGIAPNILLARMCTKKAKPNGQFILEAAQIHDFIASQKVRDLPGIGWSLGQKLDSLGVEMCADLQKISLQTLQKEFGPKTGQSLYKYCRGEDNRLIHVEHQRKSVSTEINYGIRFTQDKEAEEFIQELAEEVHKRLTAIEMRGTSITLKLMIRKADASTPLKFMGHGSCDNIVRSIPVALPTDEKECISKECISLLRQLRIPPNDLRGIGIQVSKLVTAADSSSKVSNVTLFNYGKSGISTMNMLQMHHDKEIIQSMGQEAQTIGNKTIVINNKRASIVKTASRKMRKRKSPQKKTLTLQNFVNKIANSENKLNHEQSEYQHQELKDPPLPFLRGSPSKSVTSKRMEFDLPSPSEIDPNVFHALPEDVRKSIEESYKEEYKETYQADRLDLIFMKNVNYEEKRVKNEEKKIDQTQDAIQPLWDPIVLAEIPPDIIAELKKEQTDLLKRGGPFVGSQTFQNPAIDSTPSKNINVDSNDKAHNLSVPIYPYKGIIDNRFRHSSETSTIRSGTGRSSCEYRSMQDCGFDKVVSGGKDDSGLNRDIPIERISSNKEYHHHVDVLSPSQIDESVMSELPKDIRIEIQAAIKKRKSHTSLSSCKLTQHASGKTSNDSIYSEITANPKSFMIPNKSDQNKSRDHLFSPSKIDLDVLDALPLELQQEVNSAVRYENKRRDREKQKEIRRKEMEEQDRQLAAETVIKSQNAEQHQETKPPSLCGASSYGDVKELVKTWVKTNKEPLAEDIEAFTKYLQELVIHSNLEQVFLLLKCFKRASNTLICWESKFNDVLNSTQAFVLQMYRAQLPIEQFG